MGYIHTLRQAPKVCILVLKVQHSDCSQLKWKIQVYKYIFHIKRQTCLIDFSNRSTFLRQCKTVTFLTGFGPIWSQLHTPQNITSLYPWAIKIFSFFRLYKNKDQNHLILAQLAVCCVVEERRKNFSIICNCASPSVIMICSYL